jgi:chaperone modulatory protein CbpM
MQAHEVIIQARIDGDTLEAWVAAGWLVPRQSSEGADYSEIDLARACLIADLHHLGVNGEGIPIILDLIDQVHGLRRMARELLTHVKAGQHERS